MSKLYRDFFRDSEWQWITVTRSSRPFFVALHHCRVFQESAVIRNWIKHQGNRESFDERNSVDLIHSNVI